MRYGPLHQLTRRAVVGSLALLARPGPPAVADDLLSYTFAEGALGLELAASADGRVQVRRVVQGSPAWERGVPPQAYLVGVNGKSTAGMSAAEAQQLVRQARRPLELAFDGSALVGLPPDKLVQKAAEAQGMQTATLRIEKGAADRGRTCGLQSRVGDIVEVEYEARLENGAVFDSSAQRSGRPFAVPLGNGEVVRGMELGLLEMCIGEERTLYVPPALAYGRRGSRLYGVPPDASLVYQVKLVSINLQTDPTTVRADLPDEQRYRECAVGAGTAVGPGEACPGEE